MTTFDELALSATSSGKVSAWMALIDEAIDVGKMDYVWELWLTERKLGDDGTEVSNAIECHLPWDDFFHRSQYYCDDDLRKARDYAYAVVCGDASATTQS